MATASGLICVGIISGAHGVRGLVRLKSFTAAPEAVAAYGPLSDEAGHRQFRIALKSRLRDGWVAAVEGVGDRNAAEALAGTRLYVARERLPEPEPDEFYHADLIGLAAALPDGTVLGRVAAVHDFGAGDVLEVTRPVGGALFVPFTQAVVPMVDIAGGRLLVDPPAGLLDGGAEGAAA